MKIFRNLFLSCVIVSSFLVIIHAIVLGATRTDSLHKLNWTFISIGLLIQGFLSLMSVVILFVYFGSSLWKSKYELDNEHFECAKLNRKMHAAIRKLGEHEATKVLKNKEGGE